jgi:magnesium chelatase family protein
LVPKHRKILGIQQLFSDTCINVDMRIAEVCQICQLDSTCQTLMRSAMQQMQLSARAYHRIPNLARTIADLASDETIQPTRLAEAL